VWIRNDFNQCLCFRILSTYFVHSSSCTQLVATGTYFNITKTTGYIFTYMQCDVPASGNVGRTYAALHVQYNIRCTLWPIRVAINIYCGWWQFWHVVVAGDRSSSERDDVFNVFIHDYYAWHAAASTCRLKWPKLTETLRQIRFSKTGDVMRYCDTNEFIVTEQLRCKQIIRAWQSPLHYNMQNCNY